MEKFEKPELLNFLCNEDENDANEFTKSGDGIQIGTPGGL